MTAERMRQPTVSLRLLFGIWGDGREMRCGEAFTGLIFRKTGSGYLWSVPCRALQVKDSGSRVQVFGWKGDVFTRHRRPRWRDGSRAGARQIDAEGYAQVPKSAKSRYL